MKFGTRSRWSRRSRWRSGSSPSSCSGLGEQPHGRLLAGREQVGRDAHDVDDLGRRAVGERGRRQAGEHVGAGFPAAVLDVGRELLVEELERAVHHRVVAGAADRAATAAAARERGAEHLVIALGHAEQVGDHEHGERAGVLGDELALAVGDELVELTVRQAPHELLVLLQALRRDQAHEQRSLRGVVRRIERRELVAHRQLVAVLVDERAHVVAFEGHREAGKRSGHRVARREGRRVVVDRDRFLVSGHHHDALVRLAVHRALPAQVLEVRIGVGDRLRRPGRSRSPRSRSHHGSRRRRRAGRRSR